MSECVVEIINAYLLSFDMIYHITEKLSSIDGSSLSY